MKTGLAFVLTVLLLLFWVSVPAAGGGTGRLEGTVRLEGKGIEGVRVEVHLEPRGKVRTPPLAAVDSGEDGGFTLELPPGTYYLSILQGTGSPGPLRAIRYEANPIVLGDGEAVDLGVIALRGGGGGEGVSSGVEGRIVFGGQPVGGVQVMAYEEKASRLTGPRFVQSAESGTDGRFRLPLEPGRYWIAARKRFRGASFGPPQPGDLSAEYGENPVTVAEGARLEVGDISLHEVDLQRLVRAMEDLDNPAAGDTRIVGTVVGPDGKPLSGQFVFLYDSQEMQGRPLVVTRSGENGGFAVNPPGGGRYYLAARGRYGTAWQRGDLVGRLVGREDSSVPVERGDEVTGLVLQMEQVW